MTDHDDATGASDDFLAALYRRAIEQAPEPAGVLRRAQGCGHTFHDPVILPDGCGGVRNDVASGDVWAEGDEPSAQPDYLRCDGVEWCDEHNGVRSEDSGVCDMYDSAVDGPVYVCCSTMPMFRRARGDEGHAGWVALAALLGLLLFLAVFGWMVTRGVQHLHDVLDGGPPTGTTEQLPPEGVRRLDLPGGVVCEDGACVSTSSCAIGDVDGDGMYASRADERAAWADGEIDPVTEGVCTS